VKLLLAALLVLVARGAWTHASLVETSPSDRAVLAAPPPVVVLSFSEPVEPVAVRLIDGAGAALASETVAAGATLRLTPPAPLPPGAYIVSWRVISVDAHPVSGAFQFAVGEAPSSWAASPRPPPAITWTWISVANRAVHLIALLIAVGGALYAFAVAGAPRQTMMWAASIAALTAILGVGIEGALVLETGLLDPEAWRFGATTTRGVAAAVAVVGLAGIALGANVLGALVALASFALSGHAVTAPPQAVAIPSLLIHVAIAAFWVGSLVPLRGAAQKDVARFSSIAIWLVPALFLAGLMLATLQVQRLPALVETGYGIALSIKVAFATALVCVAAYNRFKLMPRLPGAMSPLRTSIAVEIGLAMAILGATAALTQLVPPRSMSPADAAARSFAMGGEAPAAIVLVRDLVATVEVAGGTVTVGIADRAGKPVAPREVTLVLSNAAAGIEALERPMARGADGLWHAEGPAFAGVWAVRVDALITEFDKVVFATSLAIR
jgi:copper transport protein